MKQFRRILLLLLLAGCSSDDPEEIETGKQYMPLQVGTYQTYHVSETTYEPEMDPEHLQYELRMEVIDSFQHTQGGYTYVIHRSTRPSAANDWEYLDTWSACVTDFEATVNEETISYLKFTLPVYTGNVWNGNKYNSQEPDEYEITAAEVSYEVGEEVFTKTIFVDQENRVDLLFNERRFEVYAEDVGLIYKEVTDLEYCDDVDCFGQMEIEQGTIYKQSITDHGKL